MRKITALIALALAALLLASACGGGGQPAGTPTPASPAAGKIAFVSYRDGNLGIYVMNADGSGQTRLTENKSGPHGDFAPAWSPDGSRIAFMSDRDGRSNYEIYVMNADGTGQTSLTDNPDIDSNPSWSPDGSRIAFDSGRDSYEIYVTNADGSGQTRLTDSPGFDSDPAWSPDGNRIAFVSCDLPEPSPSEGLLHCDLSLMNADGSNRVPLTGEGEGNNYEPTWSPDGSRIAFVSYRVGNLGIYVMNADGSGQTRLTENPDIDLGPIWSPDGSRIAFTSDRDGNYEIYVMNADGSGLTHLADGEGPVWSPDGSRIAFASERDGKAEIYVMNADGSGQTRLTDSPGFDGGPAWQPAL